MLAYTVYNELLGDEGQTEVKLVLPMWFLTL